MKFIHTSLVRLAYLLPIFMLMPFAASFAQSFNLLPPLDIKDFPTVRAYYNANDMAGNPISGLDSSYFDVSENGVKIDAKTIKQRCSTIVDGPTLCIVLVIDKSYSMERIVDGTSTSRFEFVKNAAKDFVNGLDYKKKTSVAIVSFDGEAYLTSEFSQDKGALIDKIDKITIGSATRYDPPLLDKRWGAFELLKNKNCDPPEAKRIIIFLTDGEPNPPGPVDSVVEKGLSDLGAIFYAITAFQAMNVHLQKWSDKSGGKAFVADGNDAGAKLIEIYRRIAAELQGKTQCFLEWTAPMSCDEAGRKRKVDIKLKSPYNLSASTSYTAPANSVLKIDINPSIVFFGDPNPNDPQSQTVTITATTGKVILTKGSIVSSGGSFTIDDWDGVTPITIDSGKSRTFKITFTQSDPKAFRQGTFIVKGIPCDPPLITLVAGLSQVVLLTPGKQAVSSDTLFSSCDDIVIKWAGVKPEDPVLLQYSSDGGATWVLLKDDATGLSYTWPRSEIEKLDYKGQYKIKVLIPSKKQYIWANGGGGVQNDTAAALSLTEDGLYINICGSYQGANASFGTQKLNSNNGSVDGFVAQYDASGNIIWATDFGGPEEDRALSVVSVPGNVTFVTGFYTGDAKFGSSIRSPQNKSVRNFFVARIQPGGSIPFVYDDTKSKPNVTGESYGTAIAYEPSLNQIFVQGMYKGVVTDNIRGYTLSQSSNSGKNYDPFTAIFSYTGDLLALKRGVDNAHKYSALTATDKDGCIYETGTFSGDKIRDAITVTSAGGTDYFLSKYCGLPSSSDVSTFNATLGKPDMVSIKPELTYYFNNKTAVGTTGSEILATALCNYGTLNSVIESVVFSNDEFSSNTNLIGREFIVPNCDNVDLFIDFTPKTLDPNPHCSDITFFATCAEPVKITVCAYATEPCTFTKTDVDFPSTLEGDKSETEVKTICNTSSNRIIAGTLNLSGSDSNDFEIIEVTIEGNVIYTEPVPLNAGFNLKPNNCLTVKLRFKPKAAGPRTTFLNYNIPVDCDEAKSILTGVGIAPLALEVSPQTWACTRPNAKDTQTVSVKNIGTGDATIKSITARTGTNFKVISTLPAAPITSGASFQVSVEFTPPSVGTFTDNLDVVASSTSGDRTFSNTLTGDGCLPVVKLDKECFTLTALGSSTTIPNAITIYNTGNVPLNVTSISVLPPDLNEFINFTPTVTNSITPINGQQPIQVTFRPIQAGNRTAKVVVISDGVPGRDTIDVCGIAFAPDTSHSFSTLLTCQDSSWTYNYPNTSASDIIIDVDNSDPANFIVTTGLSNIPITTGQITIPSKGLDFIIKFKPSGVGIFTGSVLLDKTNIQVSGEGKIVPVNFFVTPDSSSPTRLYPGEVAKITVKAEVLGTLENSKLDTLIVDFIYSKKLFDLAPFSATEDIESLLTGWKWSQTQTTLGDSTQIKVIGVGPRIITAGTKDLFVLNLNSYLGDKLIYPIAVKGSVPARLVGCVPTTSKGTVFDMANICFRGGRLISVGSTYYQLNAPKPSPASNEAKFEYGIGLSGMTEITLHNSLGELVQTLVREHQEAGTYEITLDAAALPSGVYFYILHSGPYMEQQRLYIAK